MRFVEVSHRIEPGMVTYPGLPEPVQELFLDYDESHERYQGKAEFRMAMLRISGNTGTYVDAPVHRYRTGADLASLPLERLAHVPVTLVDATNVGRAIGPEALVAPGVQLSGRAVLVRTDASRAFGTQTYTRDTPYITAGAAQALVEAGAALVGIDALNIDDPADPSRPVHTALLAAGIPICEHMTGLQALPASGFPSAPCR